GPRSIPPGDLPRLAPLSQLRLLVADLLAHQMLDLEHHSANRRRIRQYSHLPHPPQTQAANGSPLGVGSAGEALDDFDLEGHRLALHVGRLRLGLAELELAPAKSRHLIG